MDKTNKVDSAQIQHTMSAYCRYIDTKQWDLLGKIIADNAVLEFQDTEGKMLYTFTGPAGLIQASREAITDLVTVHHLYNPEITISDDQHASAIWAMEDRFYRTDDAGKSIKVFHGYGHYHIAFINQANSWKIASLRLTRLRLVQY
ncbi:nuclear transport factor 2 family protein [Chitinophaga agri]|uniref:Nuclear transport factor 2 family protein n=1 Tax=Chitinophaga agri TaxID=2703787 RepID=A0A6B9ZAJ9_9BACT|nr:nuclear transport factor 2 family protein [Chitinophaga agri]QHS58839.1 nuclear transport factor 2 family protein [Chitinophaga agri]